jgi:WD40 repeat protein
MHSAKIASLVFGKTKGLSFLNDGLTEAVTSDSAMPLKFLLAVLNSVLVLSFSYSRSMSQDLPPWVTSQEGSRYKHHLPVMDVAFSPNGRWLASCGRDAKTELYDLSALQSGKFRTVGALYTVATGVAFSPDSRLLVSISMNGEVQIIDVETQRTRFQSSDAGLLFPLAFSPGGRLLAASYVEFKSGQMHRIPTPTETRFAIWDTANFQPKVTFEVQPRPITAFAFSVDGLSLLTGNDIGSVVVWPVGGGPPARTIQLPRGMVLAFSPDGRWIAAWDPDGSEILDLFDAPTGKRVFQLTGQGGTIGRAAFSPDSRWVATTNADGNNIVIWNVSKGKLLWNLTGHSGRVNSVAFSPDGKKLASGSDDKTVIIWEVATGREIRRW